MIEIKRAKYSLKKKSTLIKCDQSDFGKGGSRKSQVEGNALWRICFTDENRSLLDKVDLWLN